MPFFESINRRRIIPWLGAYLAGGFLALEGVDQLIGNSLLPAVAYRVVLTFYLFGIPGAVIMAWFHGEKGQQELSRPEIALHSVLVVGALITTGVIIQDYRAEQAARIDVAAAMGLDPAGIAVLYFDAIRDDYQFAADGLTEALIDRLSGVSSLNVVTRNGVSPFRGTGLQPDSLADIARELGVLTLVNGTVDPVGDRIHVTARLVNGVAGDVVSTESFEVGEEELLSAQDSLAAVMEELLRVRMGEGVRLRESRGGTNDVDAWSLARRGEGLIRRAEEQEERDEVDLELETLAAADSVLALAEEADPAWTEPPVLRGRAAFVAAFVHATRKGDFETSEAVAREGLVHVDRALEQAPRDAPALEMRGTLMYFLWLLGVSETAEEADALLDGARDDLVLATEIDPTLASAHAMLSHLYGNLADNTNVILSAREAYRQDAYLRDADQILERLFWAHYDLEQFNEARDRCEEGRERFGSNPAFVECAMRLLLASDVPNPDPEAAWALRDTLLQLTPEAERPYQERMGDLVVAGVLRRAGLPDSAEVVFESAQGDREVDPNDDLVVEEAKIRSATGDIDAATELLKLYVAANPAHSFESGGQLHWMWRPLRDHPEFRSVIER